MRSTLVALVFAAVCPFQSSVNAQQSWEPLNRGIEGASLHTMYETPARTLLASSPTGVFRFNEANDRWQRVFSVVNGAYAFGSDSSGATLALAYDRQVYRSDDDGVSWSAITDALRMDVV